MSRESESSAFDRLSNDAKNIFEDAQVRVMIRGSKPAVYLGSDWKPSSEDVSGIHEALASMGIDAVVLPGFVGDRAQIERRLVAEPELAKLVGWDDSRSVGENMARPETTAPGRDRNHGLLAFILGYPRSAIESFVRLSGMESRGVPTNYRDFFVPGANPSIAERILDTRGKNSLARLSVVGERARIYRESAFENARGSDDRKKADTRHDLMMLEHEMEIRELLRSYWELTETDLNDIFIRYGIHLQNASGKNLYSFATSGAGASMAPDILALQERIAKTEGPVTKVVERYY